MRVLVLGAYGLIGSEIVSALTGAGLDVRGLARDAARGRRFYPAIGWIGADMAKLKTPGAWAEYLDDVDAVVNASGTLQDGARDNLKATQENAIKALITACEERGMKLFIQISAPGARVNAPTQFMQTKAAADDALRASKLDWVIFKPGLVVSANAYGGTALLRLLAGFPLVQPLVLGGARIQTVAVSEVADAVLTVLRGKAPLRASYDLVEDKPHALREAVKKFRAWLGFPAARLDAEIPAWAGFALARVADAAGFFGWRSPLRTTALRVLSEDVTGDSAPWARVKGRPLMSLDETLGTIPSTIQERIFARQQLAFPIMVLTLAVFWIASGVIGLFRLDAAMPVLDGVFSTPLSRRAVMAGAIADILIGAGILYRPTWKRAALGSIILSFVYLLAGAIFTPHLWLDPLGPFVKIIPVIALGAAVLLLGEER